MAKLRTRFASDETKAVIAEAVSEWQNLNDDHFKRFPLEGEYVEESYQYIADNIDSRWDNIQDQIVGYEDPVTFITYHAGHVTETEVDIDDDMHFTLSSLPTTIPAEFTNPESVRVEYDIYGTIKSIRIYGTSGYHDVSNDVVANLTEDQIAHLLDTASDIDSHNTLIAKSGMLKDLGTNATISEAALNKTDGDAKEVEFLHKTVFTVVTYKAGSAAIGEDTTVRGHFIPPVDGKTAVITLDANGGKFPTLNDATTATVTYTYSAGTGAWSTNDTLPEPERQGEWLPNPYYTETYDPNDPLNNNVAFPEYYSGDDYAFMGW